MEPARDDKSASSKPGTDVRFSTIRRRAAVARVLKSPQAWDDLRRRAAVRLLEMHYEGPGRTYRRQSLVPRPDAGAAPRDSRTRTTSSFSPRGTRPGPITSRSGRSAGCRMTTCVSFTAMAPGLSGHPPASGIDDILFATGSLGHGVSLAAGLALAKRLKAEPGRVFCLTSDGEWNEGSCWEALIFARHHDLDNLTILVDLQRAAGLRHDARSRRSRAAGGEVPGVRPADPGDRRSRRRRDPPRAARPPQRARCDRGPTRTRDAASRSWKTGWNGTTCR